MAGSGRWERWLLPLWLVLTAVLVVDAALSGRWAWTAAVLVLLLLLALASRHSGVKAEQAQASSAAAGHWTPERVAQTVGGAGDRHVAAVKALRQADPRLSLLDADRLVRERPRG